MKRVLAAGVFLALALAGRSGPPPGATSKPAPRFSVASYNINYGNVNPTVFRASPSRVTSPPAA